MKKILITVISLAVILIAFLLIVKNIKTPTLKIDAYSEIIESDDKLAFLELNPTALPEGIKKNEITITRINPEESDVSIYRLQPDGLKLQEPVRITINSGSSDSPNYAIPMLIHQSLEGDNIISELVEISTVSINLANNNIMISGEINHFSDILTRFVNGIFKYTPTSPSREHLVDETFRVSVSIKPTGNEIVYGGNHGRDGKYIFPTKFSLNPDSSWCVENGTMETDHALKILPEEQSYQGGCGQGPDGTVEISGNFICKKKGSEEVRSGSNRNTTYLTYKILRNGVKQKTYTSISFHENHTCKEKPKMVRLCPSYTIVCKPDQNGNVKSVGGSYKCDPDTGELILDKNGDTIDMETGGPPSEKCFQ